MQVKVVPPDPCAGIVCENICIGLDLHSQKCVNGVCVLDALIEANSAQCGYVPPPICTEGAKRSPEACWDGSIIYKEVCRNNAWIPSGETCLPEPAHGERRLPSPPCWDGSIIHAEKYDATLHQWIPSGETCLPEPAIGVISNIQIPELKAAGETFSVKLFTKNTGGSPGTFRKCITACNKAQGCTSSTNVSPGSEGEYHQMNHVMPDHNCEFVFVLEVDGIEHARTTRTVILGSAPPPTCVLTPADYFTCPDGTEIQLNECVNGVKVPIIPMPTCPPPAPPSPPHLSLIHI